MNTTFKISLDVHRVESQVTIPAFRGDSGYTIIASLTEDGKPFPISDGSTAIFEGVKADGNYLYNACTIENGKIVYDFKKTTPDGETCQTTAVPGTVKCQFKLIGENGGIISAPQFTIVVEDTIYNEQDIVNSASEYTVLTEMVADIETRLNNGEFKGDQGEQGIQGEKGDQGIQGIQGEKGEKGDQGIQGIQGEKGDKGEQGIQGEKGADGHTPVKGVDYYTEADKNALVQEILSNFPDGNEVEY